MSDTKISEAVERLERAYISGMDEEFRDDLRIVLDALSQPAEQGHLSRWTEVINSTCNQPAELAEQQGDRLVALAIQAGAYEYGDPEARYYDFSAEQLVKFAALAATGKQQVGEVQGDARAQFEAWWKKSCNVGAANSWREVCATYGNAAMQHGWEVWQAARQPGAQDREGDDFLAGICVALQCVTAQDCGVLWREIVVAVGVDDLLQYATFIEPAEWTLAGFHKYALTELGKRKPRNKVAKPAKNPPAQGIDLGQKLVELVAAWEDLASRGIVPAPNQMQKCARQVRALIDQRDAAPGVGNG